MTAALATIICNSAVQRAGDVIRPQRDDVEKLRARLDANEWLLPGEVAALFGGRTTRSTIDNWLRSGKIKHRRLGRYRICDPADVKKELAEYEKVRRGQSADGEATTD